MNEETRKKYELLKEKNKKSIKTKYYLENELFQECLESIKTYTMLDDAKTAEIWDWMNTKVPFYYLGHIKWEDVTYKNLVLKFADIHNYSDLEKKCYIVWSNAQLPGVSCKLRAILDNLDDVSAVDFYAWIIPDDFSYIIELTSSSDPQIAILELRKGTIY